MFNIIVLVGLLVCVEFGLFICAVSAFQGRIERGALTIMIMRQDCPQLDQSRVSKLRRRRPPEPGSEERERSLAGPGRLVTPVVGWSLLWLAGHSCGRLFSPVVSWSVANVRCVGRLAKSETPPQSLVCV